MFDCCSQVSVSLKAISCQTAKKNRIRHRLFWQGTCVEDVPGLSLSGEGLVSRENKNIGAMLKPCPVLLLASSIKWHSSCTASSTS